MKALVLAAGMSTRIASVSGGIPKPLLPIAGKPVIARSLEWLADAGVHDVWINLHYRADEIRAALGDGSNFGLNIRYAFEPEILGTAGAFKALASHFDDTALVVYGDNLMSFDIAAFVAAHQAMRALATIALFDPARHPNSRIAGGRVFLDPRGRVTSFTEGQGVTLPMEGASNTGFVNAGAYLLEPDFAKAVAGGYQDFGRDVFPRQLASDSISGYLMDSAGYCLGLDTPESLQLAEQLISTKQVVLG